MEYLLHWVWIETKMCSITNLFIPHAAWTGWQTVSHLIFHTRYRGRGGLASEWNVIHIRRWWLLWKWSDIYPGPPLWGDSRHRPGPGAMADTRRSILPHPIRGLWCQWRGGHCETEGTDEPRLSQWALFWLSGSCPNKYSNMAIVGVRFSNGNVIWAKCD